LPIDFSDSSFHDLPDYIADTVTADGWSIRYFIKDDSRKYTDLYLECSKGNIKGTFYSAELLQRRRYFIPEFIGETNTNIYFAHGCATDCSAILVFAKNSTANFTDYLSVIDYNIQLGQVLFITDNTHQGNDNIYELSLADISRNKTHKLTQNKICDNVYKPACVDTVIFTKDQVVITTSLRINIEDTTQTKQTTTIHL